MHPSDRVIAHTVVQSDKATDEVTKFCHAVRGLFQIIRGAGRGDYIV